MYAIRSYYGISGPILAFTGAVSRISRRDFDVDLPQTKRRDEIGEMARAIAVVRDEAKKLDTLEHEMGEMVATLRRKESEMLKSMHAQLTGVVELAIRITSYNVCYTKLLRAAGKRERRPPS